MIAEVAPATHADWLTNLNFFLTLVIAIVTAGGLIINRPQKREVSFSTEFARKADVNALKEEVDDIRQSLVAITDRIREDRDQINNQGEERAAKIHERINGVSTTLGEQIAEIGASVAGLKGYIDRLSQERKS